MTSSPPSSSSSLPFPLVNDYYIVRHGFSLPNQNHIIVSSLENGIKPEHGLAQKGKDDVKTKAPEILDFILKNSFAVGGDDSDAETNKTNHSVSSSITIVSSPFSRTVETAEIIQSLLLLNNNNNLDDSDDESLKQQHQQKQLQTDERLRERNFGTLELGSDENYKKVWAEDIAAPNEDTMATSTFQAESLSSVWDRVRSLILDEEKKSEAEEEKGEVKQKLVGKRAVVFVAHGDVLQITQTGWQVSMGTLRSLKDHRSLPHMHQAEIRKL